MKVFIIAGEPSGDRLGGALMAGLQSLVPGIRFEGVGGAEMTEAGLRSLFDMSDLSVMGIAEILPRYRLLARRLRETVEAALAAKPDLILTIDSPDFCLRVLKRVRAAAPGIRTVHYVSPTVWAWREHRTKRMVGLIDQVLTLLPFEPPYLEAVGIRADFVGHPVSTEPQATDDEIRAFRDVYALGEAEVILALPGSRAGEVSRLAPIFGEALRPVFARHPEARVIVPAAGPVAGMVTEMVAGWPGDPLVIDPRGKRAADAATEKRAAFATARIALAASGTVSLELAAQGTPMVIAYDMNRITWEIAKRIVKVDTVTLVNLVSETRVVQEFLGTGCKPEPIAEALLDLLEDPSAQDAAIALTMERLGRGGEAPGLRAAKAVLAGIAEG